MAPRETLSERLGRVSENGLFKLYERGLIAIGMPALLATMGWGLSAIVGLQADMREGRAIQQMVLVPAVERLTETAVELSVDRVDRDDLVQLEREVFRQIHEIRENLSELETLVARERGKTN